jgi:hypothetical protein
MSTRSLSKPISGSALRSVKAIAAGAERIEAIEATVQLKRRTKLARLALGGPNHRTYNRSRVRW